MNYLFILFFKNKILNIKKIIMTTSLSSFLLNPKNLENIHDKSALKKIIKYKTAKKSIEYKVHQKLVKKYINMPKLYNLNIIDNIIYNDKTHIVSLFKDHLIADDKGDFLKRYYNKKEIDERLPKFFEFYELYSKIFPNYTCIEEGKYFYKNIQQKQKMINMIEKMEMEKKLKNDNLISNNINISITDSEKSIQKVFSTCVIDSLLNITNDEGMNILFNINKNNIKQEEINFVNDVGILIDEINKCKHNNGLNKNKNTKIHNNIINLIKNKNNKNFTKIKNMNNNDNNNQKREIKLNSIVKFFSTANKSKNKNKNGTNDFSNLYNNNYTKINLHHKHINKNSNLSKLNAMTDRALLDKLEQNYNRVKLKNQKNISQNMSTSMKTKKDISSSKKNISICSKKPNSISTSYNNCLLNNINQRFTTYLITSKGSTSEIKNIKKEIPFHYCIKSYLSSRNNALNFSSYIKNKNKRKNQKNNFSNNNSNNHKNNKNKNNFTSNNNFNSNISKNSNKNIKKLCTIKRNYNDSRNKKFEKNNNFKFSKISSTKLGNVLNYTNSIISYNDSKYNSKTKNNSKNKNKIINYANSFFDLNNKTNNKEIQYKKVESKKKLIKESILYNGFKICNSSRNKKNSLTKKTSLKNLTNSKKNFTNKNNSLIKIGFKGNINEIKKNKMKGIKINNFSKIFNAFINRYNNRNQKPNTDRNKIKININK